MKWIDRQIAKKGEMPLKLIQFYKIFFLRVLECVIIFDLFQWHFHVFCTFPSIRFRGMSSFRFCGTWSVHPFHRQFLYQPNLCIFWGCLAFSEKKIIKNKTLRRSNHFLKMQLGNPFFDFLNIDRNSSKKKI